MSLVSNNNKNLTWKTVGTFQSLNRHCQRIIPTPQCRNIKVGLIVQNSPHGYVKCNHRVCEIHRFPASILNKVILLMISRTSNNTFLFLFHFMHLHLTGCLFFKHPIASFFFFPFQLISKAGGAWSCSKSYPICAIHNDTFNSCTGCSRLRNTSHYWKLSVHMKYVVSAFPNMRFQKASREKMHCLLL